MKLRWEAVVVYVVGWNIGLLASLATPGWWKVLPMLGGMVLAFGVLGYVGLAGPRR